MNNHFLSILLGLRGRWLSPLLCPQGLCLHSWSRFFPSLLGSSLTNRPLPFHPLTCPPLGVASLKCTAVRFPRKQRAGIRIAFGIQFSPQGIYRRNTGTLQANVYSSILTEASWSIPGLTFLTQRRGLDQVSTTRNALVTFSSSPKESIPHSSPIFPLCLNTPTTRWGEVPKGETENLKSKRAWDHLKKQRPPPKPLA